uniref:Ankyrin repeat protein n=1 Tax=Lotharella globosa TaxID=91324 RepID=A0A7S4DE19_9EUKA
MCLQKEGNLGAFGKALENKNTDEVKAAFKENTFLGFHPFFMAVISSHGTWAVEMMCREDASLVNKPSTASLRILHTEIGVDLVDDMMDLPGLTPLMMGAMFGPMETVRVLIAYGAKVNTTIQLARRVHWNARDMAERYGRPEIRDLLDEAAILDRGTCVRSICSSTF